MIKPQEISKIANIEGVRPQHIEKDYVISWVLWGVYNHGFLKDALIFKGGTCIKKIFIKGYRYSEDIDFTIDPSLDNTLNEDIYKAFNEIFGSIKEAANIDLSIPEDSKDVHVTGSIKFYIEYIGPLGGKSDRIKTDIGKGEKLEFKVAKKPMLDVYSDLGEEEEVLITCYSLEEIVIEKMAALMGRTIPRDLYDFDYLTNTEGIELQDIFIEFQLKAKHKNHDPNEFVKKVAGKEKVFEKAWTANLSHQIKGLKKFTDVWRDFNKQLRKFEKCK